MTSNIGWLQRPGTIPDTWNPTVGCSRASEGCEHCYAEAMGGRIARMGGKAAEPYKQVIGYNARGLPVWNRSVLELRDRLEKPLHATKPRTYFVNSMSDLFHERVSDDFIAAVFSVIAACPQHTFIILTKRAERLEAWTQAHLRVPHMNVWLGVSAETQGWFDHRVPYLLRTPAAVRLVSLEPLLGPIDAREALQQQTRTTVRGCGGTVATSPPPLDWVIVGGESGDGRRGCEVSWITSIVQQCADAGVACFVKQDGHRKPGQQGSLSDATWAVKEWPVGSMKPRAHGILFSSAMVLRVLDDTKTQTRRTAVCRWKPGDRLWMREAIRRVGDTNLSVYVADETPTIADAWPWKLRMLPAMFCPRGLSRATLGVTSVRTERLQDISDADAIAEGVDAGPMTTPRDAYATLWDKLNGKRRGFRWADNPIVSVTEFWRCAE